MNKIPSFSEYINEGILTNYRNEKEGMKLTYTQMKGSFEEFVKKLIEEKIPFYFDCVYKNYTRIGYLMNESINNIHFNGYILNDDKSEEEIYDEFDKILQDTIIDKKTKLNVGRSNFSDLTQSNDLDTICVIVKGMKQYQKEKNLQSRIITGNKFESHVNIDFLCDQTKCSDFISYLF